MRNELWFRGLREDEMPNLDIETPSSPATGVPHVNPAKQDPATGDQLTDAWAKLNLMERGKVMTKALHESGAQLTLKGRDLVYASLSQPMPALAIQKLAPGRGSSALPLQMKLLESIRSQLTESSGGDKKKEIVTAFNKVRGSKFDAPKEFKKDGNQGYLFVTGTRMETESKPGLARLTKELDALLKPTASDIGALPSVTHSWHEGTSAYFEVFIPMKLDESSGVTEWDNDDDGSDDDDGGDRRRQQAKDAQQNRSRSFSRNKKPTAKRSGVVGASRPAPRRTESTGLMSFMGSSTKEKLAEALMDSETLEIACDYAVKSNGGYLEDFDVKFKKGAPAAITLKVMFKKPATEADCMRVFDMIAKETVGAVSVSNKKASPTDWTMKLTVTGQLDESKQSTSYTGLTDDDVEEIFMFAAKSGGGMKKDWNLKVGKSTTEFVLYVEFDDPATEAECKEVFDTIKENSTGAVYKSSKPTNKDKTVWAISGSLKALLDESQQPTSVDEANPWHDPDTGHFGFGKRGTAVHSLKFSKPGTRRKAKKSSGSNRLAFIMKSCGRDKDSPTCREVAKL